MEVLLALASGVLYAAGIYLMLRRRLAQLIIGLGLLSNGTNLLIFTAGGLTRASPPVVPEGAERLAGPYADPVPQALVLTAIVIGFGLLTFALVLVHRTHREFGTLDPDAIRETEPEIAPAVAKVVPDAEEAA
jgi:multicomponent Na+:H+ antiporter subunit C